MISKPNKCPLLMRLLHWSMAIIIFALLSIGIYMAGVPLDATEKIDMYHWHRAFGVVVFLLLLLRVVTRLFSTVPNRPDGIPQAQQRIAHIVQFLLYGCMLTIPVLGYVASSALPDFPGIPPLNSIRFFGAELPLAPVEKNYDTTKSLITLNGWLAYALISLLSLHIIGALKHRFLDKPGNDVLSKII